MAFKHVRHRVRLLVSDQGAVSVEAIPISRIGPIGPISLDTQPTSSANPFLYHKTTRRDVYDAARARHPGADDVILWNERGEITESTFCNVIARFGKERVTPPVASGLLAGTFRERLLRRGRIKERVILKDDLARADAVYLVNSVRGWARVALTQVTLQDKR
jgi:para-aminobenzoate synthetase/4-amino-4-deoxychorismate lyase